MSPVEDLPAATLDVGDDVRIDRPGDVVVGGAGMAHREGRRAGIVRVIRNGVDRGGYARAGASRRL